MSARSSPAPAPRRAQRALLLVLAIAAPLVLAPPAAAVDKDVCIQQTSVTGEELAALQINSRTGQWAALVSLAPGAANVVVTGGGVITRDGDLHRLSSAGEWGTMEASFHPDGFGSMDLSMEPILPGRSFAFVDVRAGDGCPPIKLGFDFGQPQVLITGVGLNPLEITTTITPASGTDVYLDFAFLGGDADTRQLGIGRAWLRRDRPPLVPEPFYMPFAEGFSVDIASNGSGDVNVVAIDGNLKGWSWGIDYDGESRAAIAQLGLPTPLATAVETVPDSRDRFTIMAQRGDTGIISRFGLNPGGSLMPGAAFPGVFGHAYYGHNQPSADEWSLVVHRDDGAVVLFPDLLAPAPEGVVIGSAPIAKADDPFVVVDPCVTTDQSGRSVTIFPDKAAGVLRALRYVPEQGYFDPVDLEAVPKASESFVSIGCAFFGEALVYSYVAEGALVLGRVTDPFATEFVREVEFKTPGFEAEIGGTKGGVINEITKSGGNELEGAFIGHFTREDSFQRSTRAAGPFLGLLPIGIVPEPPPGPWLSSPLLPGHRVKVRITGGGGPIAGRLESDCIEETLCVSGALAGRAEVFVRVVGPKPNGHLWPTYVKFSTSQVEIWNHQEATGVVTYHLLPAVAEGAERLALSGVADRGGFLPPLSQTAAAGQAAVAVLSEEPARGRELAVGVPANGATPRAAGDPPPPDGPWLTSGRLPGYRVKIRVTAGGGSIPGRAEADCIAETLCASGALAGRSEVFVRVVGPKPNGRLWPTLVKFSTSQVEVWIEQLSGGDVRYYRLDPVAPGEELLALDGLADKEGFLP